MPDAGSRGSKAVGGLDALDEEARANRLLTLVRDVVAEVRPDFTTAASLDATLDYDLGLDSLTRVELLLRIERSSSVQLPEATLGTARTVRDLLRALETIAPGRHVSDLTVMPVLPPAQAAPSAVTTLAAALRWHAERHPERPHVILTDGETELERISYGNLAERAAVIAHGLHKRSIVQGDRIAVMLPTGADFLACFFGILRAGAIPVPLHPPAATAHIADHLQREAGMLVNSDARFLIAPMEIKRVARLLRTHTRDLSAVLRTRRVQRRSRVFPCATCAAHRSCQPSRVSEYRPRSRRSPG